MHIFIYGFGPVRRYDSLCKKLSSNKNAKVWQIKFFSRQLRPCRGYRGLRLYGVHFCTKN